MITIFRNSWHYKLYSFYQRRFNNDHDYPSQVNLCPYMRTILLWIPLQYALRLVPIVLIEFTLLFDTVGYYTPIQVLKTLGIVLAASGIFIGILAAIVWFATREKTEPTTLLGTWLKAKHDKICPVLRVL